MEQLTFIRKKGELILHKGHTYHRKTVNKTGTSLWRCSQWLKLKCTGRLTVKNDVILSHRDHVTDCKTDFVNNEIQEEIHKCRLKVADDEASSIPSLYEEMINNLENRGINFAADNLPKFKSMKTGLYKLRNKHSGVSKTRFDKVEDVEIPISFERFMVADYKNNDNRIIIFGLPEIISMLPQIKHIFCDGTFRSCPPPFSQIYSIHGDVGSTISSNHVVPLLYVLMTNRTEDSFNVLFELIKSRIPTFQPNKFTLDFEMAAIKAIRKQYRSAEVKGCYYHFTNSVWKKARKLGLTKSRKNRRVVSLYAALPLVPHSFLTSALVYIKSKLKTNEQLKLTAYVEKFWLKKEIELWSVVGERHRTNNCLEGWHTKLNRMLGKKNRNILNFLHVLKKDAEYALVRIKNAITNARKKEQLENDEFIMESQMELINNNITVGHFLEQVKK